MSVKAGFIILQKRHTQVFCNKKSETHFLLTPNCIRIKHILASKRCPFEVQLTPF